MSALNAAFARGFKAGVRFQKMDPTLDPGRGSEEWVSYLAGFRRGEKAAVENPLALPDLLESHFLETTDV